MKKVWLFLLSVFPLLIFPLWVLAQTVAPAVSPTPLPVAVVDPNQEFLQLLIASIGGAKGASALAIAGVIIKVLLKALDLPFVENLLGKKFSDWTGGLKLTLVLVLSYVGGILALMLPPTSLTLGAALVHSTTLAAFLVLSNQLYQHYLEKKIVPA